MKSIYEISTNYLTILDQLDENGGEITPEIEQALSISENELQPKAKAYVGVIKTIEDSIPTIDDEIKRLQAIKKNRVNQVSNLKDRLSNAMQVFGIDEIKEALYTINFRSSKSIIIDDLESLPMTLKTVKVTTSADKKAIKDLINEGKEIEGARLVTNKNIQIK